MFQIKVVALKEVQIDNILLKESGKAIKNKQTKNATKKTKNTWDTAGYKRSLESEQPGFKSQLCPRYLGEWPGCHSEHKGESTYLRGLLCSMRNKPPMWCMGLVWLSMAPSSPWCTVINNSFDLGSHQHSTLTMYCCLVIVCMGFWPGEGELLGTQTLCP